MIIIKSPREIALMKEAGRIVAAVFEEVGKVLKPGMSTQDIANITDHVFRREGATSAELGYGGFPAVACVSVNEELIHGIPSKKRVLKDGDIVSLDIVARKHGYLADACRTFHVGTPNERGLRMVKIAEECFWNGVSLIKAGVRLGDVQHEIERTALENGVRVARDYTGHGIGTHMHEDPYIPNYGVAGTGPILREGMTLAIEPMILEGKEETITLKDGWTVVAKDGKLTAHYENTLVVTKDGFRILTMSETELTERGLNI